MEFNNRRQEESITPLRLDHTRITHEHLIKTHIETICDTCDKKVRVKHIITDKIH